MLDSATSLAVGHLEQELQLQPRTFAAKKSLFPTADRDLERYATERAFWITGIVKEAVLKAARNYILNWAKEHPVGGLPGFGFEEGLYETLREWLPVKDAAGRTINTASRSEVIARTNIMDMYNHARLTMMRQPELRGWVVAYRYTAIIDSVTTPICRALHGKIFTEQTINGWPPPNHYSCRSMLLPVTRLDHGWQEQMLKQGRIDVKPREGFATPTVTEGIAATGRVS
jgi:SPP1 gp7 family putative phage head morphogenesis protein